MGKSSTGGSVELANGPVQIVTDTHNDPCQTRPERARRGANGPSHRATSPRLYVAQIRYKSNLMRAGAVTTIDFGMLSICGPGGYHARSCKIRFCVCAAPRCVQMGPIGQHASHLRKRAAKAIRPVRAARSVHQTALFVKQVGSPRWPRRCRPSPAARPRVRRRHTGPSST